MKHKSAIVLPLATALASLNSAGSANAAYEATEQDTSAGNGQPQPATSVRPNTIYSAGEDLFGLLVTRSADGTLIAQHSSHSSHSSHASHSSSR
jgi:hypothetical protein